MLKTNQSNEDTQVPNCNSWGIYSVNSQSGVSYTRHTKRGAKFRISEHKQYIQKQKTYKSTFAKHC